MLRWSEILKNGLGDTKQDIIKKYSVPANLPLLTVPKLNPEVNVALSTQIQVIRRDARLVQKQEQLAAGLSAIGEALSIMLKERGEGNRKCIELLSDAGRLLCDFHHVETITRRDLISINLNKDLKDTLSDAPVDNFLFGETLEERVKAAKNLEKSSFDLKPPKPKLAKKPFRPLNTKGPSRQSRGARVGQQYERAPYQRPNALRFTHRGPQMRQPQRNQEMFRPKNRPQK